jgi:hypothetical protein
MNKRATWGGALAVLASSVAVSVVLAQQAEPPFDRSNAPTTWEHPPYASAEEQYMARYRAAGSNSDEDKLPDWSGLWGNARFQGYGFSLRPGETRTGAGLSTETTMKLTPLYAAEYAMRVQRAADGEDFDPLSWCLPAGFPRNLSGILPREFAPTRGVTFFIHEGQNEVRRIYTDGRGHLPEEFAYPMWEGDSIGFWDEDTLVVWTRSIKGNLTGRDQPAISDELQVYEEWRRIADDVMRVRVTFYDPVALREPFDFVRYFETVDTQNGLIRPAFSACNENQNVVQSVTGGSDFGFIPGVDDTLDLSNAETWLMFDEARAAGLVEQYEAMQAAEAK